ncbi:hypothetical protein ACXR0O_19375 [Verrucomicrobiota bacterium sgz303538]
MIIARFSSPLRRIPSQAMLSCMLLAITLCGAFAAEGGKPVLLYSRYFNAKGETRYQPDGTYKDVLNQLREAYDVRVNDEPLNADTLKNVALVLIANPSDKAVGNNPPPHHCTPTDVTELTRYVENGGGLIALGNQENHNLETEQFNHLLGAFGMKFENLYTDAKRLVIPSSTPVIGGLRWAYYTGNLIVLRPDHPAKPTVVVKNDLAQKPEKGSRDQEGILLAGSELGKGRVIAVTDAGCISNDALSGKGIGDVSIKEHDNLELFLRLARWAAHAE